MADRIYYVHSADGCRFESMTKEQILTAISDATGAAPSRIDVDNAFITKIKESRAQKNLSFWVGTTAEYNAIVASGQIVPDCFYILTDETFADDVDSEIAEMRTSIESVSFIANDTGWLPLKRKKTSGETETFVEIGKYRLFGKIAYVSLSYNPYDFISTAQVTDTFNLPVLGDGETTSARLLFNGSSCCYGEITSATGKFSIKGLATNQTVSGTFSFFYSGNNPNYKAG